MIRSVEQSLGGKNTGVVCARQNDNTCFLCPSRSGYPWGSAQVSVCGELITELFFVVIRRRVLTKNNGVVTHTRYEYQLSFKAKEERYDVVQLGDCVAYSVVSVSLVSCSYYIIPGSIHSSTLVCVTATCAEMRGNSRFPERARPCRCVIVTRTSRIWQ